MLQAQSQADPNHSDESTEFRRQLETILASKSFASSRQLSDFLRFIAEKSLEGATQLGQVEIARHVLGEGRNFDATYDSAIRKFASMTRQRLAKYYAEEGAADPVELSLPLRSYLPVFRLRDTAELAVPAPVTPQLAPHVTPQRQKLSRLLWPALILAAVLVGSALFLFRRDRSASVDLPLAGSYTIRTTFGDLAYGGADTRPEAVRLGGVLSDGKTFFARLTFQPEHEAQQAGILLWKDQDNYVRLGRSFVGRNFIDFSSESRGLVTTPPENLLFDSEGQTGKPLWLALHRTGTRYFGFVSSDGMEWRPVGLPLDSPDLIAPKIGIFAYHGRRHAPPLEAHFEEVSRGQLFSNATIAELPGRLRSTCPAKVGPGEGVPVLRMSLLTNDPSCSASLPLADLGNRDWTIETRIDSIALPGAMAGMYVQGSRGRLRLIRYGSDQPSLSLMHDTKSLQTVPDHNGAPPVTLRISRQGPWLTASSSKDGITYRAFPDRIALTDLGDSLKGGLILSISGKGKTHVPPEMGVYFWREAVEPLQPSR
jgi:hypothetical protein